MPKDGDVATFALQRGFFGEKEREIAHYSDFAASAFRYDTGIEALRLGNARGEAVVLPYLGQMIWSARFNGVDLAMRSMFPEPRPANTIVETYGCLAYHSGLLRNGVPGPEDSHPPHGEAPCAPMDEAGIACGSDDRGRFIAVTGAREYAMGFGAHYLARPRVILRENETALEMVMDVRNLSAAPMELMYMAHVNFAFAPGARIIQPIPFTPQNVVARTAIPAHVTATEAYRALIADVAGNPGRLERLEEPPLYDPELVFYLKGAKPDADGLVRHAMMRREGDAFAIAWDPTTMPHTIRWVLVNSDQSVAAFAMPATCEPEGYSAEKRKGHVRSLAGGDSAHFRTIIEYVEPARAASAVRAIEGSRS